MSEDQEQPLSTAKLLALYPAGEHPVIDRVERALREVGVRSRWVAQRYLPADRTQSGQAWAHADQLTAREYAAVLARFPEALCHKCRGPIEFVPVPPDAGPAFGPPYWRHTGPAGIGCIARPDGEPAGGAGFPTGGVNAQMAALQESLSALLGIEHGLTGVSMYQLDIVHDLLGQLAQLYDWPLRIDPPLLRCEALPCPTSGAIFAGRVHEGGGLSTKLWLLLSELAAHARAHRAAGETSS